jgi:hypothetical protein
MCGVTAARNYLVYNMASKGMEEGSCLETVKARKEGV